MKKILKIMAMSLLLLAAPLTTAVLAQDVEIKIAGNFN